ncbi:uncharacterized protein N0V89_008634 [Didymosphaeria variabile]|uniref:DUF300-domain-containing protein n=1 Tax=Didymosphaeria variabile TaxID=1932322 RepID=A0A9W8XGK9_9PLEO|nr:uncharacterized protein N0V89_008634 [Didymosphaeria variabile]KAJ4350013.1 hypothetical protein N0V89_008634 [Didymosphaeria variabile]
MASSSSMHVAYLVARKLRDHNDNNNGTDDACPTDPINVPADQMKPVVGSLMFHDFATILSGACSLAALLIVSVAVIRHATNFSNPIQQRQVIRILMLVPWVALFSFLIVWQEDVGEYLVESLDFGCSIAISAFLLLLCDYILSNPGGFDQLFGQGASKVAREGVDSPKWLKRTWYMVLQYLPVSIIVWMATAISLAVGTYCGASNKPKFAHIWLSVIKMASTTFAVLACLRFYKMQKTQLTPHKVMLKFLAFKGIIGLNALQVFIIGILVGNGTIKPNEHMTYHDIKTALPSLLLACEMPLFATLLFFAFPVSVYKAEGCGPAAGPITAMAQAFNITDLMSCFVRGPMRLLREQQWGMQRAQSFPLHAEGGVVVSEGGYSAGAYNAQQSGYSTHPPV